MRHFCKLSLLLLLGFATAQPLTAARVRIELSSAGSRTAVFAFDQGSFHQAAPEGGTAYSIDDLWTCPASGPRLFVFGSDNAATFLDAAAICAMPDQHARIAIQLRPPVQITLFVWLKSAKLRAMIGDELANAEWLFRRNLVGVRFKPVFVSDFEAAQQEESGRTLIRRGGKSLELPEAGCKQLRENAASFLMTGGINLYVGFGPNLTCPSTVAHPPKDIVFIQDLPVLGATAHELSHAFGVDSSTDGDRGLVYSNGHVPPVPAATPPLFEANNTLWPESMVLHDRLTMGQVYWMNFTPLSFLAESRASVAGAASALTCPRECPHYAADFAAPDPRVPLAAVPSGRTVGYGAAVASPLGSATSRTIACGGELNLDCPASVLGSLTSTVDRLRAKINMASGMRGREATFDVQFQLAAGVAGHPHYCTKEELIDSLTKRYAEVCAPPAGEQHGLRCAHASPKTFVDFWKQNVVAAGLIEATAALATSAKQGTSDVNVVTSEDPWQYSSRSYGEFRAVFDPELNSGLRTVLGKRILWMDTPGNNRIEQDLMRSLGMEVDCSSDPDDAVKQLRNAARNTAAANRYSAVIAGGGAGLTLATALRTLRIAVPEIIYSQHVTEADKSSATAAGALGETGDPIDLTHLVFQAILQKRP